MNVLGQEHHTIAQNPAGAKSFGKAAHTLLGPAHLSGQLSRGYGFKLDH